MTAKCGRSPHSSSSRLCYVTIEIGIGGFQPHPASEVLRHRYGDCKDKVTLLSSMLKEVGITSNYVLIDTKRGWTQPQLPNSRFDHAVAAIEIPAGVSTERYQSVIQSKNGMSYLIFDPTDTERPVGELPGPLQDTYALLVTDQGGELIHTPLAPPEANLYRRTGHFRLDADGMLSGDVIASASGNRAERARWEFKARNEQEQTHLVERSLNRSLAGFELEKLDIRHLDDLQQSAEIAMSLKVPG